MDEQDIFDMIVEEPKVEVKKKKSVQPAPQMITFDRYFISLGRPLHHRAGMEAYANTKGKRTRESWGALFKNY